LEKHGGAIPVAGFSGIASAVLLLGTVTVLVVCLPPESAQATKDFL